MVTSEGHRSGPGTPSGEKRAVLQLKRLETLTDVVFALVLWRLFTLFPSPGQEEWGWDSMAGFVRGELTTFVAVAIGLAFTIIYWLQNNALNGDLARSDGTHTVLSIVQLFLLLVFLKVVALSVALEPSAGVRALESGATALVGIAGAAAWRYAIRDRRLLDRRVTDEEARATRDRISAEPLTALITLPFCFFPVLWELSWFSYPVVIRMVKRRRTRSERGA